MDEDIKRSWMEFLDPDVMRPRIIVASVYVAGFEVLKAAIVDRIRSMYTTTFSEGRWIVDPKYQLNVLSRKPSPVYASLSWLQDNDVITEDDVQSFERAKKCRNKLAHELLSTLSDGLPSEMEQSFPEMLTLLRKIEVWWVVNMEIPAIEELDGQEIPEDEIIPGNVAMFQMLLDVALGDDERSRAYFRHFQQRLQES